MNTENLTEDTETPAPTKKPREGVWKGGYQVYKGAEAEYEASKAARRLARDLAKELEAVRNAKTGYAEKRQELLALAARLAGVLAEAP